MTRGMQPGSTSPKAGEYQRRNVTPLPRDPSFHWPELDTGPGQPTFYWNSRGALFFDEACTRPTRLYILELDEDSPRPEDWD